MYGSLKMFYFLLNLLYLMKEEVYSWFDMMLASEAIFTLSVPSRPHPPAHAETDTS